jgi:hypothetical protein
MRKLVSIPLALALAAYLHADWHFARPLHHRLSLDWSSHWIACAGVFALAGLYISRRWPGARWRAAIWNVALALVLAQVVEPLLEAAFYLRSFAYDVEPARWAAFAECLAAGLPALALVLFVAARRDKRAQGMITSHPEHP